MAKSDPEVPPLALNPFIYGRPILSPSYFIGRQEETKQVFSHVKSGNSVAVVGERRTGKTSFLWHLSDVETRKKHGIDPRQATLVYVNSQSLNKHITLAGFWKSVLRDVEMEFAKNELDLAAVPAVPDDQLDIDTIQNFLDQIAGQSHKIVLLLDELEALSEKPGLRDSLFDWLRSLISFNGLVVVTSSNRDLVELGLNQVIDSPFHTVFSTVLMSFFGSEEQQELVDRYLTFSGSPQRFDDRERRMIAYLSGGHPFFIQMICHFLFAAYQDDDRSSREERERRVRQQLADEMRPHLSYYWERSDTAEQQALYILATQQQRNNQAHADVNQFDELAPDLKGSADRLVRRSLVITRDTGFAIFSPVFQQWILHACKHDAGSTGLSKLWWLAIALVVSGTVLLAWQFPQIPGALGQIVVEIGSAWDEIGNTLIGIFALILILVAAYYLLIGRGQSLINLLKRLKDPF